MTFKLWQQGCDDAKAGRQRLTQEYSYSNGYVFGLQQRKKAETPPGMVARWLQELEDHSRLLRVSDPIGSRLYAQRATLLRRMAASKES